MASVPDVFPPWGAFPAEQYLLHHWDVSSAESAADQCRRLICAFVHELDAIPREWELGDAPTSAAMAMMPTEAQVREILKPWRPLRWRSAAWQIWRTKRSGEMLKCNMNVWLRTHYAADLERRRHDGERLREWFEFDDDLNSVSDADTVEKTVGWRVLDDDDVFGRFGDDWERVMEVVPELAGPSEGLSRQVGGERDSRCEYWATLRGELRLRVAGLSQESDERLRVVERYGDELQLLAVDSYLLVADSEAFDTDELRIAFLDCRGNWVRQTRVRFDEELWTTGSYIDNGSISDTPLWGISGLPEDERVEVNPAYGPRGAIGQQLYGVDDLLQ